MLERIEPVFGYAVIDGIKTYGIMTASWHNETVEMRCEVDTIDPSLLNKAHPLEDGKTVCFWLTRDQCYRIPMVDIPPHL